MSMPIMTMRMKEVLEYKGLKMINETEGFPTPVTYPGTLNAVRELRAVTRMALKETLVFMADVFGFEPSIPGWKQFIEWQRANDVSLEMVRGQYAVVLLKAIAAKHGRLNVSTQRQ